MTGKKRDLEKPKPASPEAAPLLLEDLRRMIEETRRGVSATVNAALTMLYWNVGKRVNEEILKGGRAGYGASILATVSQELVRDFGNGLGEKNLRRMVQFAEVFPDEKIVVSAIRQFSWTHFLSIIYLRWLDKNERQEGEATPIGMILCAGKKQEQIELLELGSSGIHVAEYLVELPPRKLLAEKLHRAVALARSRVGSAPGEEG